MLQLAHLAHFANSDQVTSEEVYHHYLGFTYLEQVVLYAMELVFTMTQFELCAGRAWFAVVLLTRNQQEIICCTTAKFRIPDGHIDTISGPAIVLRFSSQPS